MNRLITSIFFSALLTLLPAAHAQKKSDPTKSPPPKSPPTWPLDFENLIPGNPPPGWFRVSGDQGDDLFLISNERAATGANSLLFDRQTGNNDAMWSLATKVPPIRTGWAVFSFCLLTQGAGTDLQLGFELRDSKQNHANTIRIGLSKMKIHLDAEGVKKSPTLGELQIDKWQRVTLWIPTPEGRQSQLWVKLENRIDGKFTPASDPISIDHATPADPIDTFMIWTWPKKRNYRLFLDDFRIDTQSQGPK